jgi:dihydrodipicolinate synthase/N-acetylneuraminate lyase
MAAQMRQVASCARGFLIPGSTGDAWELSPSERRQVLTIGLDLARQLDVHVLVGALHPQTNETLTAIQEDLDWLKSRFDERDTAKVLDKARVCGFTVCPPRGKELTQENIRRALSYVLELGLPMGIYQLPQVTLNQMSAEVVADLALRYKNFILFKDTSGEDVVALSSKNLAGVFTARGAEGDYARWPKSAGGPYDGFLLASANCFARQLQHVLEDTVARRLEAARHLSDRLTAVITEMLRLAAALPQGNPFSNANKAIDHFLAHGPKAATAPPPRLHAGSCLPVEFLRVTKEILSRSELLPVRGYLE